MMYDRYDMYGFGPFHILLFGLILIIPFWQLFAKAGYSGWWSVLMIIPLVNLVALYVLATGAVRARAGAPRAIRQVGTEA